ncbi:MAG: Fe-Mn family superoxide dismutase [Deinococcaceae bacterium]
MLKLSLPVLTYAYTALEPHIDAKTMEIHHTKHHQAYIDNANKILADLDVPWTSAEELIAHLDRLPVDKQAVLRNNVGGHVNHSMFWTVLGTGSTLEGALKSAIEQAFGSIDAFKTQFAQVAMTRFGSGWAWLVLKDGKLAICSTANQDNPLMGEAISGCSGIPILGLDVWEHAYYLNYQNRRADYVASFWNVVNWDEVSKRYNAVHVQATHS